ncbi:MAG: hypothetical protein R3236_07730, partial [Phycisphaeraceae bacterium]|nr:hypothetical protein [Phycisphaeraceae bacterium]
TIKRDGVITGDIHTALTEHLALERKANPKYKVSRDGVHPNGRGHLVMAATLIKALGGDPPETDAEGYKKFTSGPKYKLIDKRRKIRSAAWRTHIGHKRPGVRKGLPIEKAQKQAAELDRQIRASG